MMRTTLAALVAASLLAVAAGCGGESADEKYRSATAEQALAASEADAALADQEASVDRIVWAQSLDTLAGMCVDQATERLQAIQADELPEVDPPAGPKADAAAADLIRIAKARPDTEYLDGVTFRAGLLDQVAAMERTGCAPTLQGKLLVAYDAIP